MGKNCLHELTRTYPRAVKEGYACASLFTCPAGRGYGRSIRAVSRSGFAAAAQCGCAKFVALHSQQQGRTQVGVSVGRQRDGCDAAVDVHQERAGCHARDWHRRRELAQRHALHRRARPGCLLCTPAAHLRCARPPSHHHVCGRWRCGCNPFSLSLIRVFAGLESRHVENRAKAEARLVLEGPE